MILLAQIHKLTGVSIKILRRLESAIGGEQPTGVRVLKKKPPKRKRRKKPLRFVLDTPLLTELIDQLTRTDDEDITYVSGIRTDDDRILTRAIPVELASASLAHAHASARSCAEIMIRLVEADLPLVAMAHSHPGNGPESTRPSNVDLRYMETLEKNGAEIIGIIVNRGGFVRFFTSELKFEVYLQGNEFEPIDGYSDVYKMVPAAGTVQGD